MIKKNANAVLALLVILASFFLSACVAHTPATIEVPTARADYILGSGDTLNITVYGHEDLSGPFTIRPDGTIPFPLIKDVPAAGYSAGELENMITARLTPDYLTDARVSVDVAAFRDIYILGEVNNPGKYEYVPNMTLLQAVATAGGYTYRADEKSADITRHVKGALTTFKINEKTMIKPGDTVVIGRRWF